MSSFWRGSATRPQQQSRDAPAGAAARAKARVPTHYDPRSADFANSRYYAYSSILPYRLQLYRRIYEYQAAPLRRSGALLYFGLVCARLFTYLPVYICAGATSRGNITTYEYLHTRTVVWMVFILPCTRRSATIAESPPNRAADDRVDRPYHLLLPVGSHIYCLAARVQYCTSSSILLITPPYMVLVHVVHCTTVPRTDTRTRYRHMYSVQYGQYPRTRV